MPLNWSGDHRHQPDDRRYLTMKITHLVPYLLCAAWPAIAVGQEPFAAGPSTQAAQTHAEIEPRTIVNATNTPGDAQNTFIISKRGSYYLTRNLTGAPGKNGISIRAEDVTLDLNGFSVIGSDGGTTFGIVLPAGRSNFSVRNGTVRSWSGGGVQAQMGRAVVAEKLRLTGNNGRFGIFVGVGSLIKDCLANGNGVGFQTADRCQVINCISTENEGHGFESTNHVAILDSTSSRNGGHGFVIGGGSTVLRCSATRNEMTGIFLGEESTVTNCTASQNVADGIFATGCSVTNCSAGGNGDSGIVVFSGVVAFCKASRNNQNDKGGVEIKAFDSVTTGNNPQF